MHRFTDFFLYNRSLLAFILILVHSFPVWVRHIVISVSVSHGTTINPLTIIIIPRPAPLTLTLTPNPCLAIVVVSLVISTHSA